MAGLADSRFAYYERYLMNIAQNIFTRSNDPLSVGILVLPDSNMLSLAACIDPLRAANRQANRTAFRWELVSPYGGEITLTSGIPIATNILPVSPKFQALIVVAGFRLTEHTNPAMIRCLRDVARRMQGIGGVDGGSWVLARAGLLDGQTATTHWEDLAEFADVFPSITVVRDRYRVSNRYFTSGGAAPAIDMMLHLIRSRLGAKIADNVASAFIYDTVQMGTEPQRNQAIARLERTTPKLARAITLMASMVEEPPKIAAIARAVGLSQRSLELLFQKRLGQSPGAYFLTLRLEEARRLTLETAYEAQDIALRTGFASQSVFARAFRREFGQSVSNLRQSAR